MVYARCHACEAGFMLTSDSCPECRVRLAPLSTETVDATLRSDTRSTIWELLNPYAGRTIGINLKDPAKVTPVVLVRARREYFSVAYDGLVVSLPYAAVLAVIEAPASTVAMAGGRFPMVVEVDRLVTYKGGTSVGLELTFE